jgi:hypothetical protein
MQLELHTQMHVARMCTHTQTYVTSVSTHNFRAQGMKSMQRIILD